MSHESVLVCIHRYRAIHRILLLAHLPGKTIIQTRIRLKRLRKQLDPLAIAMGAGESARHNEGKSLLTYNFPDGNYIVLTVWGDGFTVWTPNWNPGYEKHLKGLTR